MMMNAKIDEVYDWFKTLDGAKRIEFLNGILHLCFPLELRFIGSCIEELARKDYNYLRDAEVKANTLSEVLSMHDISDKVTRSKMIVTLALLNSTNEECARLIYDILNVDILMILNNITSINETIADEFLLLFTMATNHPAFDFNMKTNMCDQLKKIEAKLNTTTTINASQMSNLHQQPSLIPQTHQYQHFHTQIQQLPQQSQFFLNHNIISPNDNFKLQPILDDNNLNKHSNCCSPDQINNLPNNSSNTSSNTNSNAFIESISFEGVKTIKGTDNYKFIIKIHWSDQTVNEVGKTYSDLCDFNQKLLSLFSKELNGLLDGTDMLIKENQKEDFIKELPLVTEYCNKIVHLPPVISQSNFVTSFFKSDSKHKEIDDNESLANKSNGTINDSQENKQNNSMQQSNSKRVSTNSSSCGSPGLKTQPQDDRNLSKLNQTNNNHNNKNINDNRKNPVFKELQQVSLSLVSSPCVSPKIKMPTNEQSRSNSPADFNRQNTYPNLVYSPRETSTLENYVIHGYYPKLNNNNTTNNNQSDEYTQDYDDLYDSVNDKRDGQIMTKKLYPNNKNNLQNDYYTSTLLPDTNNLNQQVVTAQFKSKSNAQRFHQQTQHFQKNPQFLKQQQQQQQQLTQQNCSLNLPSTSQQQQSNYHHYPIPQDFTQAQYFANGMTRLYPAIIPINPQRNFIQNIQSSSIDSKIDLSSNSSTESNSSSSPTSSQQQQQQQVSQQNNKYLSDDESKELSQNKHTKTKIPSAMNKQQQLQQQQLSMQNGNYIQITSTTATQVPQLTSPIISNTNNRPNQVNPLTKNVNLMTNNDDTSTYNNININNLLTTTTSNHQNFNKNPIRTNFIKPTSQFSPLQASSSSSTITSKNMVKTRDKTENSSSSERVKLPNQKSNTIKNSDKIANSTQEQYLKELDNRQNKTNNNKLINNDEVNKQQYENSLSQFQQVEQGAISSSTTSNEVYQPNNVYLNAYSPADIMNLQAAYTQHYPTSMSPFYNNPLVNLIPIPLPQNINNDQKQQQQVQQTQIHQTSLDTSKASNTQYTSNRINSNEYLYNAAQHLIKNPQDAANLYNLSYLPQIEAINVAAQVAALSQIPNNLIKNRSYPTNMNHTQVAVSAAVAAHQQQMLNPNILHMPSKNRSCWNCGSSSHFAIDCKEPTLENMSQQSQFRLNFKPVNSKNDELKNATLNTTSTMSQNRVQQQQQPQQSHTSQIIEN